VKLILNQLIAQQPLSRNQAREVLTNIGRQQYSEVEIAAFITTFLMRNISVAELQGFRDALLDLAVKINLERESIDLCGTGGDGRDTFNISTLSAFIVAGAGYKVVKHGNYAASSVSGSSDVLQHLGYVFTKDETKLNRQLDKNGICFLHAPLFHPALKEVAPVRRSLQIKTFFNMLGPLVNPASPNYQLVGVYDLHIGRLYQYFLQDTDKSYTIVHSLDGFDEVTLTDSARVISNDFDGILQPADFGYERANPLALTGGKSIKDAAEIFTSVLENKGTEAQNAAVIVNAALAIQNFNRNKSLKDCVAEAKEALLAEKALEKLKLALK
jgi:anthranilate phosphoribosyltransferase